jgi:hypothetical protein
MKKKYLPVLVSCFTLIVCLHAKNLASPYIRICLPGGTNCQYFNAGSPYYRCSTNSSNSVTFYATLPNDLNCLLNGTYQWYKLAYHEYYCQVGDPDCCHGWCWDPITGATSNALTVTEPGEYYCIYNCGGSDQSTETVEVIYHSDAPTITSDPSSVVKCEGLDASFSCSSYYASYNAWQQRPPEGDWSSISGENNSSLQVLAGAGNDQYQYRCIVSNTCGSSYSDPATLDVLLKPYNITDPQGSTVCEDGTANFNTSASGDALGYQWEVSENGTDYVDLNEQSPYSGTQTKNLVVSPAGKSLHEYKYRCRISNTCATETTASATMNLDFKPDIITPPLDVEACEGDEVTFSVEVTGADPFQYRWRKNNMALGDWTTDNTYTIHSVTLSDYDKYDVLVKNKCESTGMDSEDAQLVVHPAPSVSLGEDLHLCQGESMEIDAGAGYASYEWNTGAVSQSIEVSQQGSYEVTVTDGKGCTNSDNVFVIVDPALPAIDLGPDRSYCLGEQVMLHAGNVFSNYEWSNGSTGQSINVVSSGIYWLKAFNNNSVCIAADTVKITMAEPYDQERLCIVTVDMETGKNLLVWEKTPDVGILSYNLWRETSIGEYEPIARDIPFDNLSIFKDTDVSPENRSYLYKITVTDTCGNESDLADVPYHKPIFLKYLPSDLGVSLEWTDYKIEGVSNLRDILTSYDIYRGTASTGLTFYTTVGSINDYLDTDPVTATTKFFYRVAGVLSTPCEPSAARKSVMEPVTNSMSNLEYNRGVGTEDPGQKASMLIYPNPFTEYTTIRFENASWDEFRLELVDISGKTVLIREGIREDKILLQRGGLKPGIYQVQLLGKKIYRGIFVIR